jgi:hypothetical protein
LAVTVLVMHTSWLESLSLVRMCNGGSMDAKLANLVDQALIQDVLHRFCRGMDRGDVDLAKSTFHPDAHDAHGIFEGTGWEFVDFAFKWMDSMDAISHILSNALIEVHGDTAYAESYATVFHSGVPNGSGEKVDMVIGGRYHDRLEKRDGEWRIADRRAIFDWNYTLPASGHWDGSHEVYQPIGSRDVNDQSYSLPMFGGDSARG